MSIPSAQTGKEKLMGLSKLAACIDHAGDHAELAAQSGIRIGGLYADAALVRVGQVQSILNEQDTLSCVIEQQAGLRH